MLRRLLFVFSLIASVAHAGPGQAKRDEVREKIRAMRIARLIQVLDLDERGAARLTPIVDRAYDQIAAITKDSGEARRDLKMLVVAQRPEEAQNSQNSQNSQNLKINHLIDRLLANKARVQEVEDGMIAEVRRVLSPSQVARLVVVLPEINHQIQQQIRRAAGLGPGGQPGGPPGSPVGNDDGF